MWGRAALVCGTMSFSRWAVDCKGIPGDCDEVVTSHDHDYFQLSYAKARQGIRNGRAPPGGNQEPDRLMAKRRTPT